MAPRSPSASGLVVVHRRCGQPERVEHPDQVDPHDGLEREQLVRAAFRHRLLRPAHPGAADGQTQGAELLRSARDGGAHLVFAGHVAMQRERGVAAQLAGEGVGPLVVHVRDRDLRAAFDQQAYGGLAQARRAAGHECSDAVQVHRARQPISAALAGASRAPRTVIGAPHRGVTTARGSRACARHGAGRSRALAGGRWSAARRSHAARRDRSARSSAVVISDTDLRRAM